MPAAPVDDPSRLMRALGWTDSEIIAKGPLGTYCFNAPDHLPAAAARRGAGGLRAACNCCPQPQHWGRHVINVAASQCRANFRI